MSKRFELKIGDHLKSPETKRSYNEQVFSEIAPKYAFITQVLSLWQDRGWKRELVAHLPSVSTPLCLDLACGTGDITLLLAQKYPGAPIFGLDITEPMLELARGRIRDPQVSFLNQDMSVLDFPANSVDIVTGGYALRNSPDLGVVIEEISRVLKPGGVAAFLDFSKPAHRWAQRLEYWVLKLWTGLWGILLHGNHEVYSYIAESLDAYPDRVQLRKILEQRGLTRVASRRYLGGVTELVVVRKT